MSLAFLSLNGLSQVKSGRLQNPVLNEISGVVVSKKYTDRLYVHNDSGDGNRFYVINKKGELISTVNFDTDTDVRDCEDIDIGPGPVPGVNYIYVADIGDNLGLREYVTVYRIKEPSSMAKIMKVTADKFIVKYPDGPRDAESIFIDPVEKMMYILSKREDSPHIYRFSLTAGVKDTVTPGLCGHVVLAGTKKKDWIVSASMSIDGKHIVVKTINNVYYWKRMNGEPAYRTLQRKPTRQPAYHPHGQEEAIGFTADAKYFYILSEGKSSLIYLYSLKTTLQKSK